MHVEFLVLLLQLLDYFGVDAFLFHSALVHTLVGKTFIKFD